MRKTIGISVLTTFSTVLGLVPLSPPVLAQEIVTTLTYEFDNAKEAYLNVCNLEYKLPSGRCAKINLVNRKFEGQRGLTQLSSRHLRPGARAWSVRSPMLMDVNV